MANIPKNMQETYSRIAAVLDPYCDEYLDDEYKELCHHALEKLCRKRPSPLLHGRVNTWAAGIVYAIGSANFIFDKSQKIHMTASELAEPFGISKTTAAQKASEIKKMLKVNWTNAEWVLPSMVGDNPAVWTVIVNGFAMDARYLPIDLQRICYEKGLIPYVPGERETNTE